MNLIGAWVARVYVTGLLHPPRRIGDEFLTRAVERTVLQCNGATGGCTMHVFSFLRILIGAPVQNAIIQRTNAQQVK